MEERDIEKVISYGKRNTLTLGSDPNINHVQIFENKGSDYGLFQPTPAWADMGTAFHSARSAEKGGAPKKLLGPKQQQFIGRLFTTRTQR